jgi:hypothetical protein
VIERYLESPCALGDCPCISHKLGLPQLLDPEWAETFAALREERQRKAEQENARR